METLNLKPFSILESDSILESELCKNPKILNRSITSTLYTQADSISKKLARPTIFDVDGEPARGRDLS